MALLPKVKLKAVVNFPADVFGGSGIAVRKENGQFFIDLDLSGLAVNPTIPPDQEANIYVLAYNVATRSFMLVPK